MVSWRVLFGLFVLFFVLLGCFFVFSGFFVREPRVLVVLPSVFSERVFNESVSVFVEEGLAYDVGGFDVGVYSLSVTPNRPLGYSVVVNRSFGLVDVGDYSAFLVVPGEGADPRSLCRDGRSGVLFDLLRRADERGRVLASVDYSVVVLANAGVLEGRRAAYSNFLLEKADIINGGGVPVSSAVVVDGNIVTCNSTLYARQVAQEIVRQVRAKEAN